MNSNSALSLSQLYALATTHTGRAISAIETNHIQEAYELLEARKNLVRKIQREMCHAPIWGNESETDDAALRYIEMDKKLETAIDRLG
jgi:hypothetical protein